MVPSPVSLNRVLARRGARPLMAFWGALAGYVALAWCGYQLVFASSGIASFWPPNGLIIALLVLVAPRLRVWVLAAVLPGELIADAIHGLPVLTALGWGATNSLEVCLAAWIILRLIRRERPFGDTGRDFLVVAVAAMSAPFVCGLGGAAVSVATFGGSFGAAWLGWWFGDMTGIVLLVALVVSFARPSGMRTARARTQALVEVGVVVAVGVGLFAFTRQPVEFLVLPPLLLVAVRLGARPTAIATAGLGVVATIFSGNGHGPISLVPAGEARGLALQAFIATTAFVAFLICATMTDRTRAQAELANLATHLEDLATHDPLTGLANRRYFLERLDQAVARRERSSGVAAVAYFDLDGFKQINDGMGHAAGDAMLIEVGRRLSDAIRASDLVARIGGDEFGALLEPVDSIDAAEAAARRIADAVEQPFALGEHTVPLRVSVGTALVGGSSDHALAQADSQLYADKANAAPPQIAAA
jgi:diguanylate cyclase (GGDEF)-like protein